MGLGTSSNIPSFTTVLSPITGVCDMIGLRYCEFRINRLGTANSLPAIFAKVSLQGHAAIRSSVCIDAEISGDFEVYCRYQQIVRKYAAGDLLAILAMAEASDEFLWWCLDVDSDGAAEAVAC